MIEAESQSNNKGLTFRLSPEMMLRLQQQQQQQQGGGGGEEEEGEGDATGGRGERESLTLFSSSSNENNDDVGVGMTPSATTTTTKIDQQNQQQQLPFVCLNLERLIGYKPSLEEHDSIRTQLLNAMWSRYYDSGRRSQIIENNNDIDSSSSSNIVPPPDFDIQIGELLGSGVATFGEGIRRRKKRNRQNTNTKIDNKEEEKEHNVVVEQQEQLLVLELSYPPILQKSSTTSDESLNTIRIWNDILNYPTKHKNDKTTNDHSLVVDSQEPQESKQAPSESSSSLEFIVRLWDLLIDCSQSLIWKYEMSTELRNLIENEFARLEYEEWIDSKRKTKLDNLYSVRETLVHQYEMEDCRLQEMIENRENLVRDTMQQYYRKQKQQAAAGYNNNILNNPFSLESFGTTEMSFPDEFQLLGINDHRTLYDDEDDDYSHQQSLDSSDESLGSASDCDDDEDDDDLLSYEGEQEEEDDDDYDDGYVEEDTGTDDFKISSNDNDNLTKELLINKEKSAAIIQNDNTADTTTASESVVADSSTNIYNIHEQTLPVMIPASSSMEDTSKDINNPQQKGEEEDESNRKITTEAEGIPGTDGDRNEQKTTGISLPFQKRNERRLKAKKRKKRQRKKQLEEERRKQREAEAKLVEEETRAKLTTNEIVLSQALVTALKGKVDKVEELLESLQDEVWEAEEQQEAAGDEDDDESNKQEYNEDSFASTLSFSLLDQVLAMILGTTPIPPGMTPAEHYNLMQMEHKQIVNDWENYFGRLPPPSISATTTKTGDSGYPTTSTSPSPNKEEDDNNNAPSSSSSAEERRAALGIKENDGEDWEVVDDWEELITTTSPTAKAARGSDTEERPVSVATTSGRKKHASQATEGNAKILSEETSKTSKPKLVGLRPGGISKIIF